jgi:hypothetical protein
MPHPERDAWTYQHLDRTRNGAPLAPSGGIRFFERFADAVRAQVGR